MDFFVRDGEGDITQPHPNFIRKTISKTAQIKIDILDGTLTMEFDGKVIRFNIFKAMRYLSDVHSIFAIDFIESPVQ